MIIRICDYCGERKGLTVIKLTHRPNDEPLTAELCPVCIKDIINSQSKAADVVIS